ncbi:hypothetical protein CCP3SC5AM1_1900002 [Gammaproteobacteria bacterium]
MSAQKLIGEVRSGGGDVWAVGGSIKFRYPQGMPAGLKASLRKLKLEVIEELARQRLKGLAAELGQGQAEGELLDFYQFDLAEVGNLGDNDLRLGVADFFLRKNAYQGKTDPDSAQKTPIRQHKAELVALLAANDDEHEARGRRRLAILAKEHGHPVADLLDWYKDDLCDIGRDEEANIRAIVRDYITRREIYR